MVQTLTAFIVPGVWIPAISAGRKYSLTTAEDEVQVVFQPGRSIQKGTQGWPSRSPRHGASASPSGAIRARYRRSPPAIGDGIYWRL